MKKLVGFLFMTIILALMISGCKPPSSGSSGDSSDNAVTYNCITNGMIDGEWVKASLDDTKDDGLAEVACFQQPLTYDSDITDDARKSPVYVKRLKAKSAATRQMWLLQGGPGSSGTTSLPGLAAYLWNYSSDIDLYMIDHRGVGRSDRLGCPEQEAATSANGTGIGVDDEMEACVEYVKNA